MHRFVGLALLAASCGSPESPPLTGRTFDTPWEEAVASDQRISGAFTAELGSAYPGAGWFQSPGASGLDASRARRIPGSVWPVVHVELFGHTANGWNTVDLFVAHNHWVAGDVPLDGEAATGRITTVSGEVRYLVGGELHLTEPGQVDGAVVAGWFTDVVLSEVTP